MSVTVRDVQHYLTSLDEGWVPDESVDGIEAGSADATVETIGVAWMPYERTVERAAEGGCDLLVAHEPVFYHTGIEPEPENERETIAAQLVEKGQLLDGLDVTVLRCHDLWDQFPLEGVPDTWGRQLGFEEDGEKIVSDGFFRVYELTERPAVDVAERIATNVSDFGEPAVEFVGPGDATVTQVAIGTGAITPFPRMLDEYEPDMVVCSDDGFTYWRDGALAVDMGVPVAVVNHATTEVASVALLADRLDEAFSDLHVRHFEQTCMFDFVGPKND